MAEEGSFPNEFPGEMQGNGADNTPQAAMIAQYVKDLSFENPSAPGIFQSQAQPRIDVNFNIGSQQVADEIHEVSLKIEVRAAMEQQTAFAVELVYAGLFGIRNVPEEQLQPFLFAEAPRLLFPFARRVVSDAIRDGNFPPLVLEPIDFGALYVQQAEQAGQLATGETAGQA